MRIAIVEDDEHMAELMKVWLEAAGYDITIAPDATSFMRTAGRESFDLLIIDWLLPDIQGDELLVWVRKKLDWPIPVLFVTRLDSEEDIVRALDLGADDYMTKPVSQKVLRARVRALLRRSHQFGGEREDRLDVPPFQVDMVNRRILRDNAPVELTQKEFDLTVFLFRNLGRVMSRGHILESVWGRSPEVNTRTVDTHISRLRSKLGLTSDHGFRLNAIYQHGYRLECLAEEADSLPH